MKDTASHTELEEELTLSTLGLVARLATDFQVPLARLKHLTELAYYRETRRRRMKMAEVQQLMQVGFAKVGTLSRQLKDHHGRRGTALGLERRILLLLWAMPLTAGHFFSAFPEVDRAEVEATLAALISAGRIRVIADRTPTYALADSLQRLVEDRWVARVEALNSLMLNVAQVIQARFLKPDQPNEPAFVRTLNFRAHPDDLVRLEAAYREVILPLIQELDARVQDGDPHHSLKLSYLWARNPDEGIDAVAAEPAPAHGHTPHGKP